MNPAYDPPGAQLAGLRSAAREAQEASELRWLTAYELRARVNAWEADAVDERADAVDGRPPDMLALHAATAAATDLDMAALAAETAVHLQERKELSSSRPGKPGRIVRRVRVAATEEPDRGLIGGLPPYTKEAMELWLATKPDVRPRPADHWPRRHGRGPLNRAPD